MTAEKKRMAKATLDSRGGTTSFGDDIERFLEQQAARGMLFIRINGQCRFRASEAMACPNCLTQVPANTRHTCEIAKKAHAQDR